MTAWLDNDARDEWEDCEPGYHDDAYGLNQHILVVMYDDSGSQGVVDYAIRLAAQSSAVLSILMIPRLLMGPATPDMLATSGGITETLAAVGEARLARAAASAERAQVPCRTLLRWGSAATTIVAIADQEACDLIVLGTPRQTSWWLPFLRPNVAQHVASRAKQPVLMVKER